MKKNFLLLFLMALLPLASWADDPTYEVGDYKVFTTKYVALGGDAPEVTVTKGGLTVTTLIDGGIFDASKKKVDALDAPGVYFKLVKFDEGVTKAIWVPFYVALAGDVEHVTNEEAFELSLTNGFYSAYYEKYNWCDLWFANYQGGNPDDKRLFPGDVINNDNSVDKSQEYYPTEEQISDAEAWANGVLARGDVSHDWQALLLSNNGDNWGFYNPNIQVASKAIVTDGTKSANWFDITFSADKKFSLATNDEITDNLGFDANASLTYMLVPVDIDSQLEQVASVEDVKDIAGATFDPQTISYEYDGQEHIPAFSGDDKEVTVTFDENTNIKTLEEGVDFEVVKGEGNYKNAQQWTLTINGIGAFEGSTTYVYTITGKKVIINAAYTYKKYGEDDPITPNFEVDAASPIVAGEDLYEAIGQYLTLKRIEGQEGEDVGAYLYYIDLKQNYQESCDYEISILQNNSNLVIQKADLEVAVTNYWKKFKAADPTSFEWEIVDETQLKNGDTADDITIDITRAEGERVNAHLEGTDVALWNENAPAYLFEGTAKNYNITFVNNEIGGFLIVPTEDASGIKVTVTNSDENDPLVGTSEYTYTGQSIKPGCQDEGEDYKYINDLVVSDGTTVLEQGVDYRIDSWTNHVHAGTATVTITLQGSYTEQTATGNFTIKKAPLTITADSRQLEVGQPIPTDLSWTYDGFVNNENETTALNFVEPTGISTTPISGSTGYITKVIGGSADDYEITRVDGALTYGETILRVVPDDMSKVFGEDDPDAFTYKIYNAVEDREANDAEIAAIGGNQPYFTLSREEGEDAGEYDITVDGPTVLPEGITVVYADGTFTISRKQVTLKGIDCTKVYGDENPTFDAVVYEDGTAWSAEKMTAEGVGNGSSFTVGYYVGVQGARWNGSRWVLNSEDVNTEGYSITPRLFGNPITASGNYLVVTDNTGKFTITPAPLTITADDKNKVFGEADPELTITAEGLKLNDELVVNTDYTISREKAETEAGEALGTYEITVATVAASVATGTLKNYTVTLENGTLTIGAQTIDVVALDQAINYGQKINPYAVQILIDGVDARWTEDQIKDVLMLTTEVTKVGATKDAYTLVPADNTNFEIGEFTNGWLTIAPLKEIPLDKAALAEITDIELKQVLEDHKGRTLDVLLPGRKMAADDWYAWVLPFDVKPSELFSSDVLGYGVAETLAENKTTAKKVSFGVTLQPIEANTPFLMKVENEIAAADMKAIRFSGVTISDNLDYVNENPTSGVEGTVNFIGLYEENPEDLDGTTRVLQRAGAGQKMEFWSGANIKAGMLVRTNAYLQFPTEEAADAANIFIENPDGDYTNISGVKIASENGINAEGWYNMNGVKLQNAPTQKGVYIKDGKKVVIK